VDSKVKMSIVIGGKHLRDVQVEKLVPNLVPPPQAHCVKYSFTYEKDRDKFLRKIWDFRQFMSNDRTRNALMKTAERMYDIIGYGIFVYIQNGNIHTWYPFASNDKTKPGTEHVSRDDLAGFMQDKLHLSPKMQAKYNTRSSTEKWSLSQCIMFYWEDWWKGKELYVNIYYDMFRHTLDKKRDEKKPVRDCMFFINLFDQPVITKSVCNYYVDEESLCKLSEDNPNEGLFITVFSGASTRYHQDVCMVYADAWEIASGVKFAPACRDWYHNKQVTTDWIKKKNKIVFRGRNSSCYPNDPNKNPRIKVLKAFREVQNDDKRFFDENFFDVGFSDYTTNILLTEGAFTSSDPQSIERYVGRRLDKMSMSEQSRCRFVLDIDGYVTPWRLVFELSYGSCIILIRSKYYSWFYNKLRHMDNIVIIDQDLEFDELKRTISATMKYLYTNDDIARRIGANARLLYEDISRADAVYEYMAAAMNQIVI
jgi:hypothetical protein